MEGKTPRDQLYVATSPLSFGDANTGLVTGGDVDMLCPLSPKEVGPSPPGKIPTGVDSSNISRPSPRQTEGGDSASSSPLWYETEAVLVCWELGVSDNAIDVDLAEALEKYVPDWSMTNKDRIADALSAKMSLFHIGTPTKHFHYRKMSGLELGNALMLNQAQSNSLVVETYKRWVESESSCRRFEREVAVLKKQEGMGTKVKQEIALLHASVGRLKEQVLEMKEIGKASQASLQLRMTRGTKLRRTWKLQI
ncbi:hypothetical protein HanRHA438_Chr05g0221491 [Helianthus annuus]|uniref:Uncharacterized protein n=1 Tax=Helianthus annuus TaxID=4232 RepID=A0A9K3J0X6_HELAN|nr:hypothetical protein HanXRQr2_Chr05g0212001 [Helianthus annuus]KAJ0570057.1 hypothetical protein HanHA300_Chr05g0173691 [Helianthus annuus]KAJ0576769.1 hypothetical protein HanIR_Chr05g0228201 [Helianthus annuus]KAJ0584387.1 hypothetical protein HanHA89_Chr05g0187981 [Helianthus annuus]KAJ0747013.1 hypothetical protein HanOQP8_Chr05g0184531 [Helianthus annuus]